MKIQGLHAVEIVEILAHHIVCDSEHSSSGSVWCFIRSLFNGTILVSIGLKFNNL